MLYQKYTYNYITSFQAEYTTLDNQYTMFDIIQYNMHILLTEMWTLITQTDQTWSSNMNYTHIRQPVYNVWHYTV